MNYRDLIFIYIIVILLLLLFAILCDVKIEKSQEKIIQQVQEQDSRTNNVDTRK